MTNFVSCYTLQGAIIPAHANLEGSSLHARSDHSGWQKVLLAALAGLFVCFQVGSASAQVQLREEICWTPVGSGLDCTFGTDLQAAEAISDSGSFSNSSNGTGGTWTATAETIDGVTPMAIVGAEITNQLAAVVDPGALQQVTAITSYTVSVFSNGAVPVPAGTLIPIVVNATGSAMVGIADPSLAELSVSGSLRMTLPNPATGNFPSTNLTYVATASVNCTGGFSFCFLSGGGGGSSDIFSSSDTYLYADGSSVTIQLFSRINASATGDQTVTLDGIADPDIFIDPTATFVDSLGNTVLFTDAFDLVFSPGFQPPASAVPGLGSWALAASAILMAGLGAHSLRRRGDHAGMRSSSNRPADRPIP